MLFYCPVEKEVCSCRCCLISGCGETAERAAVLFKCPQCGDLVSGQDFGTAVCLDCVQATYAEGST